MPQVAFFPNAYTVTPTDHPQLLDVLRKIRDGEWAEVTRNIRSQSDWQQTETLKKQLPAFCIQGDMISRKRGLTDEERRFSPTKWVQIDIDDVPDAHALRDQIKSDPHVVAAWVSVSGTGVKLVIQRAPDASIGSMVYAASMYFMERYGIEVDTSTVDTARLCFISYDPQLYIRPNEKSLGPLQVLEPAPERAQILPSPETENNQAWDNADDIARYTHLLREDLGAIEGQMGDLHTLRTAMVGRDFGLTPETTLNLMLDHWNHKCHPPWEPSELAQKVRNAYRYAKRARGVSSPALLLPDLPIATDQTGKNPLDANLRYTEKGYLKPNQYNASLILMYDPRVSRVFGWNAWSNACVYLRPPPWRPKLFVGPDGTQIATDRDLPMIRLWLSCTYRADFAEDTVWAAITAASQTISFNPVHDYLTGLQWDEQSRVSKWLSTIFGTPDTPLFNSIAKGWLIGSVARAMRPGTKVDTMPILEGNQGIGKSTALSLLYGRWYQDGLTSWNLDTADAVANMQGAWCVEMAELTNLTRSDTESLKAFLSRREDRARFAYGRVHQRYPRVAIFVGTTNKKEYLKDDTGNRRFWPIPCRYAALDRLQTIKDQLWAEAVHWWKNGMTWWLDRKQEQELSDLTKERAVSDPWESRIVSWLNGRSHCTTEDLFSDCLMIPRGAADTRAFLRIQGVMERAGWRKTKTKAKSGGTVETWCKATVYHPCLD